MKKKNKNKQRRRKNKTKTKSKRKNKPKQKSKSKLKRNSQKNKSNKAEITDTESDSSDDCFDESQGIQTDQDMSCESKYPIEMNELTQGSTLRIITATYDWEFTVIKKNVSVQSIRVMRQHDRKISTIKLCDIVDGWILS